MVRPKKSCPVLENRPGEKFFITPPPHNQMCIRIYIFLKNKQTKNQTNKETNKETRRQNGKETK